MGSAKDLVDIGVFRNHGFALDSGGHRLIHHGGSNGAEGAPRHTATY